MKPHRQNLDGRRGAVFSVRVTDEQRARLESLQERDGPRSLGPWLLWRALGDRGGSTGADRRRGTTAPGAPGRVLPARAGSSGNTAPAPAAVIPLGKRTILDLCAGSGAWSEPYRRAGYRVLRVTLPRLDVRTFVHKGPAWGVLAAPPCQEFSPAKRGARDFVEGMACVNACLRIVLQTRPRWWALENPVGKLATWLGRPRDVFDPCDFGDPWTKRTALWGDFALPERGPFVKPAASKVRLERTSAARAVTPAGFARAFFEANP
jgi:hypothetical protein